MSSSSLMGLRQQHHLQSMAVNFLRRSKRLQDAGPSLATSKATRMFCSFGLSSNQANHGEGSSTPSAGVKGPGVFQLTRLFDKFLRSGEDRKATEVLSELKSLDSRTGVVVCNHLLNSCSRGRNSEMAKYVWSVMKENGVQMNERSFGAMLCALTRGDCLDEAVDLLQVLYKRKMANVVMYNTVLNGCAVAKSKTYAARCVQLMDAQGVAKDEMTYVELIKLAGVQGDIHAAKKWWAELLQSHVPSPLARSPYVTALSRMNELTLAKEELQKLVADVGLRGRSVKSEALALGQVSENGDTLSETRNITKKRLQACSFENEPSSSHNVAGGREERLLPRSAELKERDLSEGKAAATLPRASIQVASMGSNFPKSNATVLRFVQTAYNSLINAAGKTGGLTLAETLFQEMGALGLKTDVYAHNALVRAVVEGRGVEPALQIVKNMEASGLQPDAYSFTALLEGYCRRHQLSEAEGILNYMESGRRFQLATCHTFNILLKACAAQGDSSRALRVFGRMKDGGIAPDGCTYLALLSACGNAKGGMDGNKNWSGREVVRRVTAIELDMIRTGVPHSPETLTTVLNVLGAEGLTAEMLQRLDDTDKHLLDASAFNTVIHNCLNAKQLETAWEIFHQMRSSGVKPNLYTYNILINGCTQDKSVSTARKLLNTMHDEGVPPDLVTYNSLLKVVCHSEQMDALPELLQRMAADGVEGDLTTFNTILTSAAYQRRVDVTEHIVEEMRRRGVSPNLHTLLPVMTAYMRVNQHDDAVEALRVLSLRMLDRDNHLHLQQNERDDGAKEETKPLLDEDDSSVRSEGSDSGEPGREEDEMRELLMNALLHGTPESIATYIAVLAGSIVDADESWGQGQRSWAARLSRQYDRHGAPFKLNMQGVKL